MKARVTVLIFAVSMAGCVMTSDIADAGDGTYLISRASLCWEGLTQPMKRQLKRPKTFVLES